MTEHDVTIRLVEPDDALPLYTLVSTNADRLRDSFPKTLEFFKSVEDAQKRITLMMEHAKDGRAFLFVVITDDTQELIGILSIKEVDRRSMKAEIAYYISGGYEGKGITTHGVRFLATYAFNEVGLRKVYARVFPYNEGSKHVLLKNGFDLEGVLRNELRNGNGVLCDIEYYGLLR